MTTEPKLPLENTNSPSSQTVPAEANASTALLDSPSSGLDPQSTPLQMWLHRTSVFLFVLISAVAGVLLVILPWTPEWTDNYLLLRFPVVRTIITTGFFADSAVDWGYSISGSASGKPSTTTTATRNR